MKRKGSFLVKQELGKEAEDEGEREEGREGGEGGRKSCCYLFYAAVS